MSVRTIGSILIVLLGLAWAFHPQLRDAYASLQPWLAEPLNFIGAIGPWLLIAGGALALARLHGWPAVRRRLRPSLLDIVYEPQKHSAVKRRNLREYHVAVRNRAADR